MLEHELCQKLVQIQSITPQNNGCLELIAAHLPQFNHHYIYQKDTSNLWSKRQKSSKHLAFAGHIDVVPVTSHWSVDPFAGIIKEGYLYGRGTNDMKGAIASFVAALLEVQDQLDYSVSLLLTSDEEGAALYGTREIVKRLKQQQETFDLCIIGEPTSKEQVGDHVKIGSRGSLNTHIKIRGRSGHVAYLEDAAPLVEK